MKTEILMKVLQLDSIIRCLVWEDRMRIHFYIQGRADVSTLYSTNILDAYRWIVDRRWQPPAMRYGQDRLLYYEKEPDQWRPIEDLAAELQQEYQP